MKTVAEIVDETVAFYGEDPTRRAYIGGTIGGTCRYYINTIVDDVTVIKNCGVGRCMIDPKGFMEKFGNHIINYYGDKIDDIGLHLKEEYRGHPILFWRDVQKLHDQGLYWGPEGITNNGIQAANDIKLRYK